MAAWLPLASQRAINMTLRSLTISVLVLAAVSGRADLPQSVQGDERFKRLSYFLSERDSPMTPYAADFIRAADLNGLDWRLLPSLAVVESSAGKYCRNHNAFGWDSGGARFKSLRHGIHVVGNKLAISPAYRGKTTVQKLRTYNSAPHYAPAVLAVMNQLHAIARPKT